MYCVTFKLERIYFVKIKIKKSTASPTTSKQSTSSSPASKKCTASPSNLIECTALQQYNKKDKAYEHMKSYLFKFLKSKIPFRTDDLDLIQYEPFVENVTVKILKFPIRVCERMVY